MSTLQRARERYLNDAYAAHRTATKNLIPIVGQDFHVTGWTGRARTAYDAQWQSQTGWDWRRIFERHRNEPDRLEMAVWMDETLCVLALGLTTGQAVVLRFLESCGNPTCPLTNFRAAIALEVTSCYAQLRGKTEIRVTPVNDLVRDLYVNLFGFQAVAVRGEEPYLRKLVG